MAELDPLIAPVISTDGPLPKRALSIPEQLDATVRQIRYNLWFLLMPVLGFLMPITLIEGALGLEHTFSPGRYLESFDGGLFGSEGLFPDPTSFFAWGTFNGIILPMVTMWLFINANRHLNGQVAKAFPPLRQLVNAYLTWLISQGISWLPVILFGFIMSSFAWAPQFFYSSNFIPILMFIGISAPFWFVWQALTFLAPPIAVATGANPFKSLKQSIVLFKKSWALIIGLYISLSIVISLTGAALGYIPTALLFIPNEYQWATQGIAIALGSAITMPIQSMASMILVRDVFIRAQGADLRYRLTHAQGHRRPLITTTQGVEWRTNGS